MSLGWTRLLVPVYWNKSITRDAKPLGMHNYHGWLHCHHSHLHSMGKSWYKHLKSKTLETTRPVKSATRESHPLQPFARAIVDPGISTAAALPVTSKELILSTWRNFYAKLQKTVCESKSARNTQPMGSVSVLVTTCNFQFVHALWTDRLIPWFNMEVAIPTTPS